MAQRERVYGTVHEARAHIPINLQTVQTLILLKISSFRARFLHLANFSSNWLPQ